MGIEIERKFLTAGDEWRESAQGILYRQGYLNSAAGRTVRIRAVGEDRAFLTIKGMGSGWARPEFEYEIPRADCDFMLAHLAEQPLIEKIRYKIPFGGFVWEIDEFCGVNAGLVIAEIELASEEEKFPRPAWLGREVTGDARYHNSSLIKNPYKNWRQQSRT